LYRYTLTKTAILGLSVQRWKDEIKNRANQLRCIGWSYQQISNELKIPKSTLSTWFKKNPKPKNLYFTNRNEWLEKIRPLAAAANRKKRQKRLEKIALEIKQEVDSWKNLYSLEVQKTMLALLYWAEGSKGREVVQFANTDPKLALLFITLLRNSFEIDESKIRIRLHLHSYHQEKRVKAFWSKLLEVSETQFNKSHRKKRSEEKTYRRNIGGICFIKYNSVYLQERIMQYAHSIAEKLIKKINVPVV